MRSCLGKHSITPITNGNFIKLNRQGFPLPALPHLLDFVLHLIPGLLDPQTATSSSPIPEIFVQFFKIEVNRLSTEKASETPSVPEAPPQTHDFVFSEYDFAANPADR